ncbi:MAG: DUF1513 domain-containing protein [Hyphomicrobiales bacterium]|nr:DUF1513 domain-containing protein [Hyphomicrobiales bacterium]
MRRRDVLIGLSASFAAALRGSFALAADDEVYAASCRKADGSFAAILYSAARGQFFTQSLPGRGHDLVRRPHSPECVAIARRPGRFAVAFNARGGEPQWFSTQARRHFYGHGAFSADGRWLYTSENDYEAGRGVIGVRDAGAGYAQIGEFSSHGVDPHDLLLTPDGKRLVIANGGILTYPDSGRTGLNMAAMEASLVYVDLATGDLIEKVTLDDSFQKLSIRHLALTGDMAVFGCQYEGAGEDAPPLIGFHRLGEAPHLAKAPDAIQTSLKNYIGSVSADASGDIIAASSPRGGLVTFWDAETKRFIGSRSMKDACGVADASQHRSFLLTNGLGQIQFVYKLGEDLANGSAQLPVAWDNHLIRCGF